MNLFDFPSSGEKGKHYLAFLSRCFILCQFTMTVPRGWKCVFYFESEIKIVCAAKTKQNLGISRKEPSVPSAGISIPPGDRASLPNSWVEWDPSCRLNLKIDLSTVGTWASFPYSAFIWELTVSRNKTKDCRITNKFQSLGVFFLFLFPLAASSMLIHLVKSCNVFKKFFSAVVTFPLVSFYKVRLAG